MCSIKILAKQAASESNALFNYVGLPLAMAGGGALLGAGLGAAHHPISEAFETDKSPESRLQRLKQKLVSGSIGGAGAGLGVLLSRSLNRYLDKDAASRCWSGYEPVPGKTPYSEDSCKPVGSKAKKKEKKAAGCGCVGQKCDNCGTASCGCNSDADPSRAVKIAAARLIIKAAGTRGLWNNVHAKRKRGERPAKPGEKDYPDSKSWQATVKAGAVDRLISRLATGRLKQAGIFYRDLETPSATIVNDDDRYGLAAMRTQEPRMLTRLFSNPETDALTALSELKANKPESLERTTLPGRHLSNEFGAMLQKLYPSRYRDPQEGELFSTLTDLIDEEPEPASRKDVQAMRQRYSPMMHQRYASQGDKEMINKLFSALEKSYLKRKTKAASDIVALAKFAAEGAWTRSEGKSESGGLNAKGRASLKAQGHDIKPPVTEDNPTGERAGRRASFCARMSGMKRKLTSVETARDPDSRINKSLRKWKC